MAMIYDGVARRPERAMSGDFDCHWPRDHACCVVMDASVLADLSDKVAYEEASPGQLRGESREIALDVHHAVASKLPGLVA